MTIDIGVRLVSLALRHCVAGVPKKGNCNQSRKKQTVQAELHATKRVFAGRKASKHGRENNPFYSVVPWQPVCILHRLTKAIL